MEEIRLTTWDVKKTVDNRINYQPQLVSRISEPSTVLKLHATFSKTHQPSGFSSWRSFEKSPLKNVIPVFFLGVYISLKSLTNFSVWDFLSLGPR